MSTSPKKMQYVRVGSSGLTVSKLILGCMTYGSPGWMSWILEEEQGIEHIKFAYDKGINTFDTSNVYSNGLSEEILGKAIRQHNLPRDEIVIMTKLSSVVGNDPGKLVYPGPTLDAEGYANQYGLSRKHIFDSVKHSLRRLQVDHIDVLQVHYFDPNTPIEETMQAFHDVVKAGYVRYIGACNLRAWQFHIMQNYAINNKLTAFISLQNHYNLVYREDEREMFPTLKHFGAGLFAWSPLARGYLTRPLKEQTNRGSSDLLLNFYGEFPESEIIVNRVEEIAKKKDITMAQVALAWSLSRKEISAPIVGSTSTAKLQDLIDAIDIKLTDEEIKYLEEAYKPRPLFLFS